MGENAVVLNSCLKTNTPLPFVNNEVKSKRHDFVQRDKHPLRGTVCESEHMLYEKIAQDDSMHEEGYLESSRKAEIDNQIDESEEND